MKRVQFSNILKELSKKMVFSAGPRQVGKTFIHKRLTSGIQIMKIEHFLSNLFI